MSSSTIQHVALASPSDKASILALRTVADASSVNCHGKVHAGWLLGKVDLAASLVAERLAAGEVATVALTHCQFPMPVHVGDIVSCFVTPLRLGEKSLTLKVECFADRINGDTVLLTEVALTFVAVDALGHSRALPCFGG